MTSCHIGQVSLNLFRATLYRQMESCTSWSKVHCFWRLPLMEMLYLQTDCVVRNHSLVSRKKNTLKLMNLPRNKTSVMVLCTWMTRLSWKPHCTDHLVERVFWLERFHRRRWLVADFFHLCFCGSGVVFLAVVSDCICIPPNKSLSGHIDISGWLDGWSASNHIHSFGLTTVKLDVHCQYQV